MLKKVNHFILSLFLLVMESCSRPTCLHQEEIDVPCNWQTLIRGEMTKEDPLCFQWLEALNDPILTSLVKEASCQNKDVLLADLESKKKRLQTIHTVSVDIAKNYIELRGLQARLKTLNQNIEVENEILGLSKGLSNRGFYGLEKENEDKKNLNSLLEQKAKIEFSIEKIIFHLTTLVGHPPGMLDAVLRPFQNLPELSGRIPVGIPEDLIYNNPTVREAKKQYEAKKSKQTFFEYQKTLLEALESAESALSAFNYESNKVYYLENTKRLSLESIELTKDLYDRGLKDDRDFFLANKNALSEENILIQGKVDLLNSYINLYDIFGYDWEECSAC